MRLILVILLFFAGSVHSRFYERNRFDRLVHDNFEAQVTNEQSPKKQWIFTDYETRYTAYRDRQENNCYIEKLSEIDRTLNKLSKDKIERSKILYASLEALTKLEAWRIAGGRIVDFCSGRNIILLQDTIPTNDQTVDPFFNTIPLDENDIVTRRVADVVLMPLISRAKRQIALEERQKMNENYGQIRRRRQVQQPRGRFRGQTQSQYLNFGNNDDKEGKAEAEATQQSSRAIVSGSRGMGQAQSMSMGGSGCEDCPTYAGEGPPDKYIRLPDTARPGPTYGGTTIPRTTEEIRQGTGGINIYPGTFPTTGQPGDRVIHPDRIGTGTGSTYPGNGPTGGVTYPGRVPSTSISRDGTVYPGGRPGSEGDTVYPSKIPMIPTTHGVYPSGIPGPSIRDGTVYPSTIPSTTTGSGVYPGPIPGTATSGGIYPGILPGTTGGGVTYPGSVPGTTTGTGVYPGTMPGTIPGGGVSYPGNAPGTTTGGAVYPGTLPGTTTGSVSYPGGIPTSGVTYPGSAPGATTGTGIYPGTMPDATTGSGGTYPGSALGATAGSGGTYPGSALGATAGTGVYPGTMPGATTGSGGTYPGSAPGATTGTGVYPGTIPGGLVSYPGSVPGTTAGGGIYPATVTGTATGGGVSYPGSAPGGTTTGTAIYPGTIPGTTTGGGVPYIGGAPSTTTTSGVNYPRSTPGGTTTGIAVYPGTIPGTTAGGRVAYSGSTPGTTTGNGLYPASGPGTTPDGGVIYPGNIPGTTLPGGVLIGPGGQVIQSKATADTAVYPRGLFPGSKLPDGGIYPVPREGVMIGPGVVYPGLIGTGTIPGMTGGTTTIGTGETVAYPNGTLSPPDQLRKTVQYPGSYPGYPVNVPTKIGDPTLYPSNAFPKPSAPNIVTGLTGGSGTIMPYPPGTQPHVGQPGYSTGIPAGSKNYQGIPYPHNIIKYPGTSEVQYTGAGRYPDRTGGVPGHGPHYGTQQGRYPSTIPGIPEGYALETSNRQGPQLYPSGGQNINEQYSGLQYPIRTGPPMSGKDASQYYQQIGEVQPTEDDNSNSQASSSVKQIDTGTQASASAQGLFGQGTSQSQVTGTYSGSGSFSAQAGSSDVNKSAQTEISGGKEGAISSAQGIGGYGKSQTQVQLDSQSGATQTGAQTSGWNHGTNSQVQASSKGGMADAQANGEGSTSSQAQIGFQPYLKENEKVDRYSKPFRGGGTASAQSGMHRGQSQSQLQGSFQYGITYTGAAQAGSGSGAAASRKPFNFSFTDTELFKQFKPYNSLQITKDNKSEVTNTSSDLDYEYNQGKSHGLQTSSSSRKAVITNATGDNSQNVPNRQDQVDDTVYDYVDEYDGDDYDTPQTQTSMNSRTSKTHNIEQNTSDHQSQAIRITTGNQYNVRVNQDSNTSKNGVMLQPGESFSGYTIPTGFRGKVTSVAGDETIADGDGKSQSQTVSLVPVEPNTSRENKSPLSETRSLKTTHEKLTNYYASPTEKNPKNNFSQIRNQQILREYTQPSVNVPIKPSYYTVTNSVTGKIDGIKSSPKKYEHRYYTKSSTCGYFTFSCNVVHGSNGRTKICKPKLPTYPDGTPMKC